MGIQLQRIFTQHSMSTLVCFIVVGEELSKYLLDEQSHDVIHIIRHQFEGNVNIVNLETPCMIS